MVYGNGDGKVIVVYGMVYSPRYNFKFRFLTLLASQHPVSDNFPLLLHVKANQQLFYESCTDLLISTTVYDEGINKVEIYFDISYFFL